MSKDTISKLYNFISKIVILLENDLNQLGVNYSQDTVKIKKNMIETLYKLVNLITKLNKLYKEDYLTNENNLQEDDILIIKKFLEEMLSKMNEYNS